jgi:hypothetical protein
LRTIGGPISPPAKCPFIRRRKWLLDTTWAWHVHKARATYIKRRLDLPWPFGTTQGFFVGDFFRRAREQQIVQLPRVADAKGDEVRFADGKTLRPSSIIWATGYDADYSWIDLPICDANGRPNLSRQARRDFISLDYGTSGPSGRR